MKYDHHWSRIFQKKNCQKCARAFTAYLAVDLPILESVAQPSWYHSVRAYWECSDRSWESFSHEVSIHTEDLHPRMHNSDAVRCTEGLCVVLTGSTGSPRNHLLDAFLKDSKIAILFLSRASDALHRHERTSREWDIKHDSKKGRVSSLKTDFGHPQLRLGIEEYDRLRDSIDVVIHNAWKVDFNHSLESFEDVSLASVHSPT